MTTANGHLCPALLRNVCFLRRASRGTVAFRRGTVSAVVTCVPRAPIFFLLLIGTIQAGCGGTNPPRWPEPPAECGAPTSIAAGPFPVVFRVRNAGNAPVFLRNGCLLEFKIASCAAGYTDALQNQIVCPVCPCWMPKCSIGTCGGCAMDHGEALAPAAVRQLEWDGIDHAVEPSRRCVRDRVLPSGQYRIRISTYATAEDAVARRNPRLVEVDFQTPVAGGVVDVVIPTSP